MKSMQISNNQHFDLLTYIIVVSTLSFTSHFTLAVPPLSHTFNNFTDRLISALAHTTRLLKKCLSDRRV